MLRYQKVQKVDLHYFIAAVIHAGVYKFVGRMTILRFSAYFHAYTDR